MASAPTRPCAHPHCPLKAATRGRCPEHQRPERTERAAVWHRLYGSQWQRYRLVFLSEHPLCADIHGEHRPSIEPAVVVDHIKPHRGDLERFWDPRNHQALCVRCHNVKTATEG